MSLCFRWLHTTKKAHCTFKTGRSCWNMAAFVARLFIYAGCTPSSSWSPVLPLLPLLCLFLFLLLLSHNTRLSLPIRRSSVVSSRVLAFSAALIPLWCVCVQSLCPRPPPFRFVSVCVCVCVYLGCVFPPSRGFGLLTLQTLSLITVHNKSLRALRDEFISLRSTLLFLSFPLSCSYFLVFYLFFFFSNSPHSPLSSSPVHT